MYLHDFSSGGSCGDLNLFSGRNVEDCSKGGLPTPREKLVVSPPAAWLSLCRPADAQEPAEAGRGRERPVPTRAPLVPRLQARSCSTDPPELPSEHGSERGRVGCSRSSGWVFPAAAPRLGGCERGPAAFPPSSLSPSPTGRQLRPPGTTGATGTFPPCAPTFILGFEAGGSASPPLRVMQSPHLVGWCGAVGSDRLPGHPDVPVSRAGGQARGASVLTRPHLPRQPECSAMWRFGNF